MAIIYRLYEISYKKKNDAKSITARGFKTISKYADWLGKVAAIAKHDQEIEMSKA